MRILPAVDILGGRVVQLRGGDPDTRLFDAPNPIGVAQSWVDDGARGLHIVDLDAALGKGSNQERILDILHTAEVPVQVGGGIRDAATAAVYLRAGARRVVVGTQAWTEDDFLDGLVAAHPGRIVVAVETKGGKLAIKGWTETIDVTVAQAIERLEGVDIAGVLATCIDVEGRGTGPDASTLKGLADGLPVPVIGSGGVKNASHVAIARDAGCAALVIGTALYTGTVSLTEAQEVANDATDPFDA